MVKYVATGMLHNSTNLTHAESCSQCIGSHQESHRTGISCNKENPDFQTPSSAIPPTTWTKQFLLFVASDNDEYSGFQAHDHHHHI